MNEPKGYVKPGDENLNWRTAGYTPEDASRVSSSVRKMITSRSLSMVLNNLLFIGIEQSLFTYFLLVLYRVILIPIF